MEREIFVSTGDGISVFSLAGEKRRNAALKGAGALCVMDGCLLCTGENGRVIWRLDRSSLMPQTLHPGGPGVCDLQMSPDGERLYALCSDADSVLMLDARSGQPLVVNRAGSNPRQMALDHDMLAVAGGESGCVHLYDARSLEAKDSLPMPGPVYSVAMACGRVHALCLTQTLASALVTVRPLNGRHMLMLDGMPGCLCKAGNTLFAATHGWLFAVSMDGGRVLKRREAPGRAGRLLESTGQLYAVDVLAERLLGCKMRSDGWQQLCASARDMAIG